MLFYDPNHVKNCNIFQDDEGNCLKITDVYFKMDDNTV